MPFVLTWYPSHQPPPRRSTRPKALARTTKWWKRWSARTTYEGDWADAVNRSVITLKALTYAPTGGIVAAPTTSLPEWPGSVRNWDYRFCWLRDATFTLYALMSCGLRRRGQGVARVAAAGRRPGDPAKLQIMYGPAGERRLTEFELAWLSGLRGLDAGAGRERRVRPVPARRVRRGGRRAVPGSCSGRRPATAAAGRCTRKVLEFLEDGVAPARRGHLGGAGATPALHPLEGDGVGGVRPGGEGRSRSSATRARRRAGVRSATRSTPRSAPRATTPTATRSCRPTDRSSSTPAC